MPKKVRPQGGKRRSWIVVKQLSTGRWFHDHAEMRTTYQRDKDFEVQAGTWATRDLAKAEVQKRREQ